MGEIASPKAPSTVLEIIPRMLSPKELYGSSCRLVIMIGSGIFTYVYWY